MFDHAAPIGAIVTRAPSQFTIYADFSGRPAHAGIAPEEGRSAIAAAARAISEMRLGRLDEQTTASVGVIAGGTARNIIPEHCGFEAEARSLDHEKARRTTQAMVDAIQHGASLEECGVETRIVPEYEAYRLRRTDPVVSLAARALEARGHVVELLATGGGADAHVLNARGIECANLSNGMAQIHTAQEHISVARRRGDDARRPRADRRRAEHCGAICLGCARLSAGRRGYRGGMGMKRPLFSYANVASTLALVLATTGVGVAATSRRERSRPRSWVRVR